jgi:hypothetical protein
MTAPDKSIYHKNLMPVVYVIGDVAGVKESPVYAILEMRKKIDAIALPEGYGIEQHTASLPDSDRRFAMKWDGEWHITYEVFRDHGDSLCRGAGADLRARGGLVPVFFDPGGHHGGHPFFADRHPAGPLGHGGLFYGHVHDWLYRRGRDRGAQLHHPGGFYRVAPGREGHPLDQAVIDAGAVRFRPMMLTAAAVVVGASVILFDPIFQGLAISLMAGEVASLLFSRMTVPILYYMDKRWEAAHGHDIGAPAAQSEK